MAKLRDKKSKDLEGVRCIKVEGDKVLMKDEEVQDHWKRYFYSLLNKMNNSNGVAETSKPNPFFYCRKIKIKDVKDALD